MFNLFKAKGPLSSHRVIDSGCCARGSKKYSLCRYVEKIMVNNGLEEIKIELDKKASSWDSVQQNNSSWGEEIYAMW